MAAIAHPHAVRKSVLLLLLLGGCTSSANSSAWSIDDRYSQHVVDGYVGYMRDNKPEERGSLNALLQKSGDGSISVTVGAWGCPEQDGKAFEGTDWNSRSRSERAAAAKRALLASAERVASVCRADLSSITAQMQQFDSAFAELDSHPQR